VSRAARSALALAVALAAAPQAAAAHQTLHEVQRGRAVAVRAWFADGEPLAYVAFEVYAPADGAVPWQTGRTDRAGWLAFVPDAPGPWRVRVLEESGHGLDLKVDAAAPTAAAPSGPATATAYLLRLVAGLLVIGAIFAALALARRRKGHQP
jgi:nickel transport protein